MAVSRTLSTLEGPACKHDGGAMFGNAPRSLWMEWIRPDHDNLIELACRSLLIQEAGRNILVVAGGEALLAPQPAKCRCRAHQQRGLLDSLAAKGLREEDVHAVVLAHLRVKPSVELMEAVREGDFPRLLFPRARYILGRRHWLRAGNPHPGDRATFLPQLLMRLEDSNRLELLDDSGSAPFGADWRFHFSDGYTPGQLHPEIAMPGGPILFAGDLIPARHWLQLPLATGYDRNPELLIEEKERFLDYAVASRCRLVFARDPDVACAGVMRDRKSHYVLYDRHPSLSGQEH